MSSSHARAARRSRRLSGALSLVACLGALVGFTPVVEGETLCRMTDPRLVEISGLARSQTLAGVYWTHNDSSDDARLYGIDAETCAVVAEVLLRGVTARDIEGIAPGFDRQGRPVLWVADIGDNRDSWSDVGLYRIREPKRFGVSSRAAREIRFTYDDRPHNAETILVAGDQVWVATWQLAKGGLYEASSFSRRDVNVARRVDDVGGLTTDGAVAPDLSGYVVRDYFDVHVFQGLPPGRKVATLALPAQPQGEAIAWAEDGEHWLIASEADDRLISIEIPWWVRASLRPPDHLIAVP